LVFEAANMAWVHVPWQMERKSSRFRQIEPSVASTHLESYYRVNLELAS
jgi:hypothetical protein